MDDWYKNSACGHCVSLKYAAVLVTYPSQAQRSNTRTTEKTPRNSPDGTGDDKCRRFLVGLDLSHSAATLPASVTRSLPCGVREGGDRDLRSIP